MVSVLQMRDIVVRKFEINNIKSKNPDLKVINDCNVGYDSKVKEAKDFWYLDIWLLVECVARHDEETTNLSTLVYESETQLRLPKKEEKDASAFEENATRTALTSLISMARVQIQATQGALNQELQFRLPLMNVNRVVEMKKESDAKRTNE